MSIKKWFNNILINYVFNCELDLFQMKIKVNWLCLNWERHGRKAGFLTITYSDFSSVAVYPVCFSVQSSIWAKERGLRLPSITMPSSHWRNGGGVFLWRGLHTEGRLQICYLPERRMEQSHADQLCVQSRWILTSDICQTTSQFSTAPSYTSVSLAICRLMFFWLERSTLNSCHKAKCSKGGGKACKNKFCSVQKSMQLLCWEWILCPLWPPQPALWHLSFS